MKGNNEILESLNTLLAEELTAINQYMVHSELCANWGLGKLYKAIWQHAMDEMHHAEWLIERIIFLEGAPTVSKLNPITIGKSVIEMINFDCNDEVAAVRAYNDAIKLARMMEDQGTVDLLSKILAMEEAHVDWAEIQIAQINQMGMANYLTNQANS
jgi:bacterioferritin